MPLTYDYTDIAPPGVTADTVTGINDLGQIVGYFGSSPFVYSSGAYSVLGDISKLVATGDINNLGQFPYYILSGSSGFGRPGHIYPSGGPDVPLDGPNAINDAGQVVGTYLGVISVGYLYSDGAFTTLQGPADFFWGTHATDINNAGQVVGYYSDGTVNHGFFYDNGTYTTLDDPRGTNGTYPIGINDTGQIVGYYINASGQHGFLYNAGTFYTVDNLLGVGGTYLTNINDYGQIVGNYIDGDGFSHGFLGDLAFSAEVAGATVYTAEYGFAPDAAELNVLIDFTTPQYAYGQQIGVLDPTIYAFEALGVTLASTATYFQDTYGPTVPTYPNSPAGDAQFAADAYLDVFGHAATSAQVDHFIAQLDYFETLYTAAGVFGSAENIDLLARGAVYGQMLGFQAELDPFGPGGSSGLVPLVGMSAAPDTALGVSHT